MNQLWAQPYLRNNVVVSAQSAGSSGYHTMAHSAGTVFTIQCDYYLWEDARISSCGPGGRRPVAKIRSPWSIKSSESSESSASWWNSGTGPLEQLSCLRIRALLEMRS